MADLQPVTVPSPGFLGINKEARQTVMSASWATEAQNAVVDGAGRLAARKGWTKLTTSAIAGTPNIESLAEYLQNDGTAMLVAGAGAKLYQSTDNGASFTDKTGSVTVNANKWQFANFNSKVFAAQPSHNLIVKNTTGNFADLTASSGTVPDDPVAILSAFGRLWAIEADRQTLKYCALMDETLWDEADGGGEISLSRLWTQGTDEGVALGAFGSTLVVFGRRHIFLYTDGRGSDRGLDPAQMYIYDTIEGQGCAARDSVQTVGEGDLMWLSQSGIRSIARVLQEQAAELKDATGNNQDYLISTVLDSSVAKDEIRSVYSPEEQFYLLIVPDASNTFCVDMTGKMEDGTQRVTEWPGFTPGSVIRRVSGTVVFGFSGVVGDHSGYNDDTATYRFVFRSSWVDQGDNNAVLKIPKRAKLLCYAPNAAVVTIKWFFDFKRYLRYAQATLSGDAPDEYDVAEYGTAQYSSALAQREVKVPMSGSGQYIMVGVETEIDGLPFAMQSLTVYQVPGRLA